ncbi:MAG: pilin [Patescibacteria group bacterium]
MRPHTPLFAFLLVAGSLALPLVAQAGGIPFLGPIVPDAINRCAAGWGMLITVINNIISLLLTLAIVFVAPLMIAWAGFLFVVSQGDSGKRTEARKILTNTIVGIVIALAGWMIVDAIMVVLYNPDAKSGQTKLGVWSSLITSGGALVCIPIAGSLKQVVTPSVVVTPTITGDEAAIRATLSAAGISINKSPCPANTRYQDVNGGCTTVGGLNQNTVAQVINLKNICGSVQVTGGNELGHTDGGQSHTTGYKVDLATNIDSCITGGSGGYFSAAGTRSSNQRYLDKCNNEYVRESTHWDITLTRDCLR